MSPCQNGIRAAASAGAGTTSTLSCVIRVILQELDAEQEGIAFPGLVDHLLV